MHTPMNTKQTRITKKTRGHLKRTLPLLLIVFALAGCYRQAGDAFESVDGQGGAQGQNVPATFTPQPVEASPTVIVIQPDATSADDANGLSAIELTATAIAEDMPTSAPLLPPTDAPTDAPVLPATDVPTATPTVIVIQLDPATNTPARTPIPSPQAQGAPTLIPTATQPNTFITPESVEQVDIEVPTATATLANATTNNTGLITPTAIPTEVPADCIYVVQSGDNLFRIALNNNIALADLLSVNGLQENSIIQPNQELTLPDCVPDLSDDAVVPDANADADTTNALPTALPAGTELYVVRSGDTLLSIARRYGITISDIVEANSLANPDALSVGQELLIPIE
jgi:LysM repeat protein